MKTTTRLTPQRRAGLQTLKSALQRLTMTLMLVMLTTAAAWAATNGTIPNTNNNLLWDYNTETKTLTISGSGAMPNITNGSNMPWEQQYSYYKAQIEHIVIGAEVTTIGDYNFDNLSNLSEVTFNGNQVTYIGTYAFKDCKMLATITLPTSLTTIGSYAFGNSPMTSITIPASVTTIGSSAFSSSNLATVTFAEGSQLTTIGSGAFQKTPISSITIPEGVTTIGGSAFYYCTYLSSVTLPNSLTSINTTAFYHCTNLKDISIPSSVTSIGVQAFKESGLMSATIQVLDPTTLTIGNNAFESGVTLKVNYTEIWSAAYPGLSSSFSPIASTQSWESGDTDVKLYDDGTVIVSKKAGDGDGAMADYVFLSDRPWNDSEDGIQRLVVLPGVTTTGKIAFADCQCLTSIALSGSVTTIKKDAFHNCNSLASVNIPGNVATIEAGAFVNCSDLSSLTLNDGLTTIATEAFGLCTSLTSVSIPSTVTSIDPNAFHMSNHLTTISVDANNATYSSVDGLLYSKDMTKIVIWPAGKSGSYTIPNCVTTIGMCAFHDCTGISSITIPASVTYIDDIAFDGCTNLSSVTIYAPSLTQYGSNAFNYNADGRKIYVFSDCQDTYKSDWYDYRNDIEPITDVTVNGVTVNQNPEVTSDYWCTYYHPAANVKINTDGVEIYKAALNGTNSVTLTKVDGNVIKFGQAVMLKASASGSLSMELTPDEAKGNYSGNELKGGATVADGYTAYTLAAENGKMGFYKFTGAALNTNKAHLEIATPPAQAAPAYFSFDFEEPSDIKDLKDSKGLNDLKEDGWYTMDGRKLQCMPITKGVFINNGRKVVIK